MDVGHGNIGKLARPPPPRGEAAATDEGVIEVGTTRTGLKAEESPDSVERALSLQDQ